MQLTINSEEPLDQVLAVVGALYGVKVAVTSRYEDLEQDDGQGVTRPRHD